MFLGSTNASSKGHKMDNKILRLPDVKIITQLSRSSIYAMAAKNIFPKPIRIGIRAVGWLEGDVQEWISARINASRSRAL
jgi:prophage regulatory protein